MDIKDKTLSPAQSLFLGNILEDFFSPFPRMDHEQVETLKLIIDSVGKFLEGEENNFRRYDEEAKFPDAYIKALKDLGLFGLIIPEEYGGIGIDNLSYARVFEETSYYDASTSVTLGAHSSIGLKGILLFGSEEQKKRYLPKLATGEYIAAFCLTEPTSGSDAASIKTKAERDNNGDWILNGSKLWISNGGIADIYTVFARTNSEKGKLSAFIVERSFDGVSTGEKEDKMGIRASNTTTVEFENVRVPKENLLGEEGKGFKIAMSILNNGRTGLAGGCVGGIKRCIALASSYASERKQFGRPIAEFKLIREKIAQMTVDCYVAESLMMLVAGMMDAGAENYSVEAAISKVFNSEAMWRAANSALQIAGGNGYMKDYPYERIVRDCRINLIFEGTNEILRMYIALSGCKVAGEQLKEIASQVSKVMNDPIKGFGVLKQYAGKKLSHLTPLGRDRLEFTPPVLESCANIFENYTAVFGKTVESVLRQLGKDIVENQLITKRIADSAIHLFAGLAVLGRVSDKIRAVGEEDAREEIKIANIFSNRAKRIINQSLRRIDRNEDNDLMDIADRIISDKAYKWDIF